MEAKERLCDLMRQGFMKPRYERKRRVERPTVACTGCKNWHPEGKHTLDRAARKANLQGEKLEQRRVQVASDSATRS